MNYLFLAIVISSGLAKGYCGKKTSGFAEHFYDAAYISTIRLIICAAAGSVLCIAEGGLNSFVSLGETGFYIAMLSGAAQAGFVTTWLLAVRNGAYTMLDAFLTLGILIPTVLCDVFFDEKIKLTQWAGFALLIVAVSIMCSYNNQIKAKITPKSLILLIVCGVFSGISDFSQKLLVRTNPEASVAAYNFYAYIFAALILAAVFVLIKPKGEKACSVKKFGIYIIIMAVCLFLNSYFKTLAGRGLTAFQIYPVCQGLGMILSAIMAAVCFKEPIKTRSIIGMTLTFVSLMIILFV